MEDGKIVPPDQCAECGEKGKVQGHHDDYSKPFEVVWLCGPCHNRIHHNEVCCVGE
jgi:hypothetical protein